MGRLLRCIECEDYKDEHEFYSDTTKRGFTKRCKDCFDIYQEYKVHEKEEHCNWCFGYGVFKYDGVPLGIHEVKQRYAVKSCRVCGANYQTKKRSVIKDGFNPKYKW